MVGNNQCGDCTACCALFPIAELGKGLNEGCAHCDGGCTIYDTRPQSCTGFNCLYLQSSAPVEVRPDRCGIVFEKLSSRLIYGTTFKKVSKWGAAQTHAFVRQGFSVILIANTGKARQTFLSPRHDNAEIEAEFQARVGECCGNLRD